MSFLNLNNQNEENYVTVGYSTITENIFVRFVFFHIFVQLALIDSVEIFFHL